MAAESRRSGLGGLSPPGTERYDARRVDTVLVGSGSAGPGGAVRRVALGAMLALTWFLWSGHVDGLLLSLGLASVVGVVWMMHRMDIDDQEGIPTPILRPATLPYLVWLLGQMVLSNLTVVARIWRGPSSIAPSVVRIQPTQQTAMGRVLHANSITLTPGTVAVRVFEDEIIVHALIPETAQEVLEGEMNRRVSALEAP